jgi:hypothetical protein
VRAVMEVPSPRLKDGIMLVDTPGLGSLAKRGAAETLAYLPSCDLALLLIDAGATLNEEDIGTLRLLYEAGIPALVLLSKSDLLANGDLHRTISYIEEQLKHELGIATTVHAVSALNEYQVLLDQYFERELLPHFEKARSLREASIARKIGAMRDAIMAALDSNLHREKRNASPASAIVSDFESVLRVVTGEVGEQHTVLDHAFRTLGETPDVVIETVTDKATSFVRSSTQQQVSPLQFSEWIHEAVNDSIQSAMSTLRNVGKRAVEQLQQIAKELGRTDAPSQSDFDTILREMPRFEMAALPRPFDAGPWRFWGHKILRSRIKASLRQSIAFPLKEDLHLYGLALSQWSGQIVRKLELLINSYADAYRMQIHRSNGTSDSAVNPGQLQADLELLRTWHTANSVTVAENTC